MTKERVIDYRSYTLRNLCSCPNCNNNESIITLRWSKKNIFDIFWRGHSPKRTVTCLSCGKKMSLKAWLRSTLSPRKPLAGLLG